MPVRQLTDPWVRSRLIDILDWAREQWDIVLVDTPGHQSAVITAALGGSSGALVPMVPEAGPVAELPTILTTIRSSADSHGRPEVYGIIRMRIWGASVYRRVAEEQIREIAERFEVPLFRNKIPEDAKFGEAHLVGLPVGAYHHTRSIGDRLPSRRLRTDPAARLALRRSRAGLVATSKRDETVKRLADRLPNAPPRGAGADDTPATPRRASPSHPSQHRLEPRVVARSAAGCADISSPMPCTPMPVG